MWMSHWGLSRDPFAESDSSYVSLPSHDEAVARLLFSIEASRRLAVLTGPAGMGKSTVLRKVRVESQNPRRRFASIVCPHDGKLLFAAFAEWLIQRVGRESSRLGSWRALERGLRLASLEGCQLVLVVDDCDDQVGATVLSDLESLARLGLAVNCDLTIILIERNTTTALSAGIDAWSLPIRLERLTRSQAERLLAAKLEQAGNSDGIFTPRAITRLHALSLGVPRKLEQLAFHCLISGAARGLEAIPPDLVDATALATATDASVSNPLMVSG